MTETPEYLKNLEGFFIPSQYKFQVAYRTRPIFRATFLLAIITALSAGLASYAYYKANEIREQSTQTQQILTAETNQLLLQKASFANILDKFQDLQKLREHLRVPIAPILDAIEKTIPDPIAVTKISVSCPPATANNNAGRKATITLEVFFSDQLNPNEDLYIKWPQEISKYLQPHSLKTLNPEWSAPRRYTPSLQTKIQRKETPVKEASGKIKELTFSVELQKA